MGVKQGASGLPNMGPFLQKYCLQQARILTTVTETSFLAKTQAILLSLVGYLQGLQAYFFGCAVMNLQRSCRAQPEPRKYHRGATSSYVYPGAATPYISYGALTCCSSSFTSRVVLAASSLSGIAEAIAAEMQAAPWL